MPNRAGRHGWFQTDQDQIILPDSQVWKTNSLHKSTHSGRDNLETLLNSILYHPQLAKAVQQVSQNCDSHLRYNPKTRPLPPPLIKPVQHRGSHPQEDQQVDFTAMPKTQGFSYLLVLVDTFIGWTEAFLTKTELQRSLKLPQRRQWLGLGCPNYFRATRGPNLQPQYPRMWPHLKNQIWSPFILAPSSLREGGENQPDP